jgi:hypothetical protein
MYYCTITEENLDFITEVNGGVRPQLQDEDGNDQIYIMNSGDEPNEIISVTDGERVRDLVQNGTLFVLATIRTLPLSNFIDLLAQD